MWILVIFFIFSITTLYDGVGPFLFLVGGYVVDLILIKTYQLKLNIEVDEDEDNILAFMEMFAH